MLLAVSTDERHLHDKFVQSSNYPGKCGQTILHCTNNIINGQGGTFCFLVKIKNINTTLFHHASDTQQKLVSRWGVL